MAGESEMPDDNNLDSFQVEDSINEVIGELEHFKLWLGVAAWRRNIASGEWDVSDDCDAEMATSVRSDLAANEARLAKIGEPDLDAIWGSLLWIAREVERRVGAVDPADDESLEAF